FSYDLSQQVASTGAQLLWRAKVNYRIETVAELEDGSYLGVNGHENLHTHGHLNCTGTVTSFAWVRDGS
ncbi:MAG: hypothetical protein ACP5HZ_12595, partial [Ferrimicrobium sp.]